MSGKSNENHEMLFFIALILFMALCYFLKTHFQYIAVVWKFMREVQCFPFTVLPHAASKIDAVQSINTAYTFLVHTPADEIDPETVTMIDSYIGTYVHIVSGLLLITFGYYKKKKTEFITSTYDIETLISRQTDEFPELMDYKDFHPENYDIEYVRGDKQSTATAASIDPQEFAVMSPPLGLEHLVDENGLSEPIWDGEDVFNENLAKAAFEAQLGNLYYGYESLQEHEQRYYNILAKLVKYDYKDTMNTLSDYTGRICNGKRIPRDLLPAEEELYKALSLFFKKKVKAKDKAKFSSNVSIKKLIANKQFEPLYNKITTERVMARHAYIRTGLYSLLIEARKSGTVASSAYRWMKAIDRTLWYSISNLGRKVAFIECAGIHAQWLLETDAKMPIPVPEVTEAVIGLKNYIYGIPETDVE